MLKFKGCQNFRQRLLLSTLSGRSIRIDDIRAQDENPGLRGFEASFLRLIEKLTNGCIVEINETGEAPRSLGLPTSTDAGGLGLDKLPSARRCDLRTNPCSTRCSCCACAGPCELHGPICMGTASAMQNGHATPAHKLLAILIQRTPLSIDTCTLSLCQAHHCATSRV